MNYQPNYYNNPYLSYYYPQQQQQMVNAGPTNIASQFQQPLQQQLLQQQPQQQSIQTATMPALNGKIVDSEDVVKVTEIPFGGYGIFPKADLNEIYLKTWNNNGTTAITKYKPVQPPASQEENPQTTTEDLLEHIQKLENKIDKIIESGSQVTYPVAIPAYQPQISSIEPQKLEMPIEQAKKKEVPINAF